MESCPEGAGRPKEPVHRPSSRAATGAYASPAARLLTHLCLLRPVPVSTALALTPQEPRLFVGVLESSQQVSLVCSAPPSCLAPPD